MARGWDSGNIFGTSRILCALPPGGAAEAGGGNENGTILGPNALIPNVSCGLWPRDATPPEFNLGAGNFSLELWYCMKTLENTAPDRWCHTGFMTDVGTRAVGTIMFSTDGWVLAEYDNDPGNLPNRIRTAWSQEAPGWHHAAVNFTRLGNMEFFVDGISRAAVAINNTPCVPARFCPPATYTSNDPTADTNNWGLQNSPVVAGPIAAHTGVLTQAQLESSVRGRRVNNLPTTLVNWNWRGIRGHTGWQFDMDRIIMMTWAWLDNVGVGAPIGAPGTVVVPDVSGNGNDWVLPTLATYGTITAQKSPTGFLADSFWNN